MGKLEDVMKAEIGRLAKKQVRAAVAPLQRDVRRFKRTLSQLVRATSRLEKAAAQQARRLPLAKGRPQASEEEVRAARLSPRVIKNLRRRLGISQEQLAALADVTPGAVAAWEQGRAKPRGINKSAVVALRKFGRRDVKRLLATKDAAPGRKRAGKKPGA